MKIAVSLCALFSLPALPLLAATPDSAYQALRTVGTERGQAGLSHVIEVVGRGGVPQPVTWRVVLDDPASRGGVRELDVAHGKIVAEHTPVQAYSGSAAGATVDFHKLNLDSPGLFTVVEKEAQKDHIGFDSVDYTLRTGDGPDAGPVWVVNLMNATSRSIGTMTVSAETGAVVGNGLVGHRPEEDYVNTTPTSPIAPGPQQTTPPPDYTPDHDNVNNNNTTAAEEEPTPQRQEDENDTEDTQGLHVGHRIKKAFLQAGESLSNFFTGHHSD